MGAAFKVSALVKHGPTGQGREVVEWEVPVLSLAEKAYAALEGSYPVIEGPHLWERRSFGDEEPTDVWRLRQPNQLYDLVPRGPRTSA